MVDQLQDLPHTAQISEEKSLQTGLEIADPNFIPSMEDDFAPAASCRSTTSKKSTLSASARQTELETAKQSSGGKEAAMGHTESMKRREKVALTFIPEGEREVVHRFRIIWAGFGARQLAERLVSSEINENYRPKLRTPTASRNVQAVKTGSEKATKLGPLTAINIDGSSKEKPGDSQERKPVRAEQSNKSETEAEQGDEDHLCIYCPIGLLADKLVRLRFNVIEGFSASMPNVNAEENARNTCVVLLHWTDANSSGKQAGASDVGKTTREFTMRTAEANFSMQFMPLVFMISVGASHADEAALTEHAQKLKLKDGAAVRSITVADDSETTLMNIMSDLCQVLIKEHDRPLTKLNAQFGAHDEEPRSSSKCCAIL